MNAKNIEWISVRVHSTNLVYQGKLRYYSETLEPAELLLNDVIIYNSDTGEKIADLEVIYLNLENNNFTIELTAENTTSES